jgi:hypothetical protein
MTPFEGSSRNGPPAGRGSGMFCVVLPSRAKAAFVDEHGVCELRAENVV